MRMVQGDMQTKNQLNELTSKAASAPGEIGKLDILNSNLLAEKDQLRS